MPQAPTLRTTKCCWEKLVPEAGGTVGVRRHHFRFHGLQDSLQGSGDIKPLPLSCQGHQGPRAATAERKTHLPLDPAVHAEMGCDLDPWGRLAQWGALASSREVARGGVSAAAWLGKNSRSADVAQTVQLQRAGE